MQGKGKKQEETLEWGTRSGREKRNQACYTLTVIICIRSTLLNYEAMILFSEDETLFDPTYLNRYALSYPLCCPLSKRKDKQTNQDGQYIRAKTYFGKLDVYRGKGMMKRIVGRASYMVYLYAISLLLSIWRILKSFVSCKIQFYSIRVLLPLPHPSTLEKIKNQERREKKKKLFKDDNQGHRFHLPIHLTDGFEV